MIEHDVEDDVHLLMVNGIDEVAELPVGDSWVCKGGFRIGAVAGFNVEKVERSVSAPVVLEPLRVHFEPAKARWLRHRGF